MKADPEEPRLVALLGDSTLDNKLYVGGEPDVKAELAAHLPEGSDALLLAVDGSVMADIPGQLRNVPAGTTQLVVSIGGNDALGLAGVLSEPVSSVADGLARLVETRDVFRARYRAMLAAVLEQRLPVAICTIYEPRFPDAAFRHVASIALDVLNSAILHEAFVNRLPVIDLRLVCTEDGDFTSTIEPSQSGGAKIAGAIARLLRTDAFHRSMSAVLGSLTSGLIAPHFSLARLIRSVHFICRAVEAMRGKNQYQTAMRHGSGAPCSGACTLPNDAGRQQGGDP